jgi:pimeloyl-ACP methyl ester carboxylesterase
VHGAGDDGPAAWPTALATPGAVFLRRVPGAAGDSPHRDAERLLRLAADDPVHLTAWSYGGLAALLAAHAEPDRVRSLVLLEPSCADLARDAPSVVAFRRGLEPAYRVRGDAAFLDAFAAATESPLPDDPDARTALAERLRATPPPWAVALPRAPLPVPTLVVTGGWAAYFEEIAAALVGLGAQHRVLPGHGHAVPHHPDAPALLRAFAAEHTR